MSVLSNNTLAGSSGQGGGGYEIERSLRFNSGDSSYLNRTPSSAGNRKTWTWSGWVKRSTLASHNNIFSMDGEKFTLRFTNIDNFEIYDYTGGYNFHLVPDAKYRDPSAWYHIVFVFDSTQATNSNRMSLYVNGVKVTSFTSIVWPAQNYDSSNTATLHVIGNLNGYSHYFDGYLADIHFIDGQALAASDFGEYDTNNVWQPKKYAGTYGTNGFHLDFSDTSSNAALGTDSSTNSNTWTVNNLVAAGNSYTYTDAVTTTENGGAFYTGVPANLFSASTNLLGGYNSSNYDSNIIWSPPGGLAVNNPKITAQYYTKIKINGTTVASEAVGGAHAEQALSFVGTLNTLIIENTDGLGSVVRAFGLKPDGTNLVTITDSALTDALRDTPVNGDPTNDTGAGGEITGNYATLNPLDKGAALVLADGNLKVVSVANDFVRSTIAVSSGKWYAEYTHGTGLGMVGVADKSGDTSQYLGQTSGGYGYYSAGTKYSGGASSYANSYTTGDVIGIAFDADNGTLTFYKNNTSQGTAFTGLTSGPYFFAAGIDTMANSVMNFGQRAFAYTAPSGYKALCTANLPDPTIADGSTAFDTKLCTGNGSSSYTISGLSFSPDLVWTKRRDAAGNNALCDTVRGVTKTISSDRASAEHNCVNGLTFTSNG